MNIPVVYQMGNLWIVVQVQPVPIPVNNQPNALVAQPVQPVEPARSITIRFRNLDGTLVCPHMAFAYNAVTVGSIRQELAVMLYVGINTIGLALPVNEQEYVMLLDDSQSLPNLGVTGDTVDLVVFVNQQEEVEVIYGDDMQEEANVEMIIVVDDTDDEDNEDNEDTENNEDNEDTEDEETDPHSEAQYGSDSDSEVEILVLEVEDDTDSEPEDAYYGV